MSQIISPVQTIAESKTTFEIGGYFNRIGYKGSLDPSIETLRGIHLCHAQTIPFENLNPLLRIPVVLDVDSLYKKLILDGRGGYCFEHNLLLMHVLKTLGFNVRGLGARVLWNVPDGVITARGHMLLLSEIDHQHFIADVGFGGLTLTAPLWLKADIEQQTPHERFKLTRINDDYLLEAKVQGVWKRIYSFGLQENYLPDYEVTSWYLSNHPTSHFVTSLIAALPFENGRYALRNNDFTTHNLDGTHERRRIEDARELGKILREIFGISLPEASSLDPALQKIIAANATK